MDTSETYIKMVNCPEIQEQWKNENNKYPYFEGSYYYNGEDVRVVDYEYPFPFFDDEDFIWLPQQDDLQEMMKSNPVPLLLRFANWVRTEEGFYFLFQQAPIPNPSMEQLWLAFVMKERFSKVWDGGKWVG